MGLQFGMDNYSKNERKETLEWLKNLTKKLSFYFMPVKEVSKQ